MANTLNIGGGGSVTDADLVSAITDELVAAGFTQGGGGGVLEYAAYLTQSGTNPPTATECVNTTGMTMSYSYVNSGEYLIEASSDLFFTGKTSIDQFMIISAADVAVRLERLSNTQISIKTVFYEKLDPSTQQLQDNILSSDCQYILKITVYP